MFKPCCPSLSCGLGRCGTWSWRAWRRRRRRASSVFSYSTTISVRSSALPPHRECCPLSVRPCCHLLLCGRERVLPVAIIHARAHSHTYNGTVGGCEWELPVAVATIGHTYGGSRIRTQMVMHAGPCGCCRHWPSLPCHMCGGSRARARARAGAVTPWGNRTIVAQNGNWSTAAVVPHAGLLDPKYRLEFDRRPEV